MNRQIKEQFLRPFVPSNCPLCKANFEKGSRVPGQRFKDQEFVTYECGCEAEINEYQPNKFNIFVRNCGNNQKCIPTENLIKAEVELKHLNTDHNIFNHLNTLVCFYSTDEFIDKYYYIFSNHYINLNQEEKQLCNAKSLLILFSTNGKSREYLENIKHIYPDKYNHLYLEKLNKKQIISKYRHLHSHALLDLETTKDSAFIITSKTQIVKLA